MFYHNQLQKFCVSYYDLWLTSNVEPDIVYNEIIIIKQSQCKKLYSATQSINGAGLKEHWAAQHCLQEAIVAQRSSVYRIELFTVVCKANGCRIAASLDSHFVGHVPRQFSRLLWKFFTT